MFEHNLRKAKQREISIEEEQDLEALLRVFPPEIQDALREANRGQDLLEVVMDLGRVPEARFLDHEVVLSEQEVTREDIDAVLAQISPFDADNRSGIERTLHRISAIRNRSGDVVGLTCRVGRAIYGTIGIIEDIVHSGRSVLLLGRPGVGKTTMLRETARVLAEKSRVVIVDTSNEIGGDGDIPHPAVGRARRMQVAEPVLQHEVMIEAVENHMPEVIVIDEIGRELEALAARTIAERGVQLIATAHGNTLENLILNPTLRDLIGGIESVTLSDEEARHRGTQKTVLERRAPPTFDVVIEIQDWDHVAVHADVAQSVDGLLRNRPVPPRVRYRNEEGEIEVEGGVEPGVAVATEAEMAAEPLKRMRIYPYGVARNRLRQAAQELIVPIEILDELDKADVVLTLKSHYRNRPRLLVEAEDQGISIYVLRSNTLTQIQNFLAGLFDLERDEDSLPRALRETQEAIRDVIAGTKMVELAPQNAYIRRRQHELARSFNLISHSRGKEPRRRVRIYRE
ncbi:MAG TPA: R3H domain-containing nucleic acid-binding protein [Anaerolineae bacterium]|nr:R3H domain-containing nucleic acid-binding protein [Anaerolineae bacterium]